MATQKQSYGIKVAQPGYSTDSAPDYALAFNSSWPALPIIKEFTVQVSSVFDGSFWNYPNQVFTHNLNMYAWAQVWETNAPNPVGSITTRRVDGNLLIGNNAVVWTSNNGYNFSSVQTPTITLHVKVYNIDMTTPIQYDYVQPPVAQLPYDSNFGIKVVKEGKSIDSKDLRDFIIHSRAQSPAILAILTQANADASGNVTYTNPQGYTNWVYGYVQIQSGSGYGVSGTLYQYAPSQGQAYPVYQFVNGNTYQLSTNATGTTFPVTLIVLRDPLFVPASIQVTY